MDANGREWERRSGGSPKPARAWRRLAITVAITVASGAAAGSTDLDAELGEALFERTWVAAPASTDSADGLGPLYNARACSGCHPQGGRGWTPGPADPEVSAQGAAPGGAGLVLHLGRPGAAPAERALPRRLGVVPEPTYGVQIQTLGVPGHAAEGRVAVRWTQAVVELPDGERVTLHRPDYRVRELGYGPLDPTILISPRLAPPLFGLGGLEQVPEAVVLALADPEDRDRDGISGRPNRVWDPMEGRPALGRWGRKAGAAQLQVQVETAFANDLGISTPHIPEGFGDCTHSQTACRTARHGNSPRHGGAEAGPEIVALVTGYVRGLTLPAPAAPLPGAADSAAPSARAGAARFAGIGCAACHRPALPTATPGTDGGETGATVPAYTDLLLHDLGEDLADGRPEWEASGREWRTAPLVRTTAATRSRGGTGPGPWLHDGRARTLTEAILWHGGEARAARDAFVNLPQPDRATLLRLLESL